MLRKLMVPTKQLITIPETMNLQQALDILSEHNLRCAPVLDSSEQLYRGNIYRYHIYKYYYEHPDKELRSIPVTHLLKNSTHVIDVNESFVHLFFAIRDLPYVAVMNEQRSFIGVIYHRTMREYFAESWNLESASYILAITLQGKKFEYLKLSWILRKYSRSLSIMTLEETEFDTNNYYLVILPDYLDMGRINRIVHRLNNAGYETSLYAI